MMTRFCSAWFVVGLLFLFQPVAVAAKPPQSPTTSIKITQGYRNENLDWNISGGGVNVLSELTWHDLHLYEVKGEVTHEARSLAPVPILFDLDVAYGWVLDGEGRDSDYAGNDRTLEFSRSSSSADGSHTFDISLGVGPVFQASPAVQIIPKLGYYYHETGIDLTDGVQEVSEFGFPVPLGSFPGLDSTYDASWHGPMGGVQCILALADTWALSLEGTVYYADYYADAVWNLRTDFDDDPSFEQEAEGYGFRIAAELEKSFLLNNQHRHNCWASVLVGVAYDRGETDRGTDEVFFANGTSSRADRLNEVNWENFSAYLALKFRF